MDFFEAIQKRRSIRKFTDEKIPEDVIRKALDAALLAPNSSNTQTWNFFWVKSPDKKSKLVEYCFSQSAARTAQELIVITADPALWRRSKKPLAEYIKQVNGPKQVVLYYDKLIPFVYTWGIFNSMAPFKWLIANVTGLFRPVMRGPYSRRDMQEVAIKSAALAAENFVLAMTAQGYATCMMEGFDESRVRRLLKLSSSERVVMVVGIGKEAERGTWGPRFRIDSSKLIFEI